MNTAEVFKDVGKNLIALQTLQATLCMAQTFDMFSCERPGPEFYQISSSKWSAKLYFLKELIGLSEDMRA